MTVVAQDIHRKEIAQRLNAVGAPQNCLARCAGLSDGNLSLVLSGERLMSQKAQLNVIRVLHFFEVIAAEAAPAPVRFSDVETIEKLYKQWRRKHEAEEVVRCAEE